MTAGNGQNVIQMSDHASASEQASRWIARIDAGSLTPEERQELRAWISSAQGNAELLDRMALLWGNAGHAKFPEAQNTHAKSAVGWWPVSRGRTAALGLTFAAVMSIVVVGGGVFQRDSRTTASQYATAKGKTSVVPLNDGSTLHLNTASTTRVEYSGKRRLIVLEQGEGYFEVAKDRSRPFDVLAGDTIVRAVGTKFSVHRLEAGRIDVTVTEGIVEILPRGSGDEPAQEGFSHPVRLAQGQSGIHGGQTIRVVQRDEKALDEKLAWLHGRLTFDGEALVNVVAEVNRYSTEKIVLADPSLAQLKVSGSFNIEDVPVFLTSLRQGFGIAATQENGVTKLSRAPS